jgi:hypothetical protein
MLVNIEQSPDRIALGPATFARNVLDPGDPERVGLGRIHLSPALA